MRKNLWLLVGLVIPASVLAQEVTNTPAAIPAKPRPAASHSTPAPARAAELRSTPLRPGPATVVARNVNVRGRPGLKGEVVARVTKGDQVTVLEETTLAHSAADEPSAWAKIVLPPSAHVWVHSEFIKDNTVVPKRLNLRGGPGENFSVLGTVERGDTVKVLRTQKEWSEIEPPAHAYAFIAAQFLEQTGTAPGTAVAATTPSMPDTRPVEVPVVTPTVSSNAAAVDAQVPETPVTASTVTEGPDVKAATSVPEVPKPAVPAEVAADSATATWSTTNEVSQAPEPEPTPALPRIVQREGVVRGTISIQAPTRYELWSPESGKIVNYLYNTAAALDLARYKGMRIVVTGEEALDERWRNTPVITIQKIVVVGE